MEWNFNFKQLDVQFIDFRVPTEEILRMVNLVIYCITVYVH